MVFVCSIETNNGSIFGLSPIIHCLAKKVTNPLRIVIYLEVGSVYYKPV